MANYAVKPGNSLAEKHPELVEEWDYEKNEFLPQNVNRSSARKAFWICKTCSYEWESRINGRVMGRGCPKCAGMTIVPGVNDFATTHPEYASWWNSSAMSPTECSAGSRKEVEWKCPEGHIFSLPIKRFAGKCVTCATKEKSVAVKFPHLVQEWHERNEFSAEEVSYSSAKIVLWLCATCSHEWSAAAYQRTNHKTGCPRCANLNFSSSAEDEIADWLSSELNLIPGVDFLRCDRTVLGNKELDFWFPSLNIAIEFNGLYWHSEATGKGRYYHYDKWKACQDKGIQLVQVWEDDWTTKQDVVKRMLTHKLGKSSLPRIPGRKTFVDGAVSKEEAREFLEENHIQGFVPASYYVGLRSVSDSALVAVMLLRKTGKPGELTLSRYATSHVVPGGQSKILSWVDKNVPYQRMVTFADLTVSDGNLYELTSWVKEEQLAPDYMYVYRDVRHHKFSFRKSRFRDDPTLKFEEGMSESQLAVLNSLARIWDTGKIRYSRSPQSSTFL